jgi:acetyl esterase/lipase
MPPRPRKQKFYVSQLGCGNRGAGSSISAPLEIVMPLDRHARRFLEMIAAAGGSQGRYRDVSERRQTLSKLMALVDPPGAIAVGGARDRLMPVAGGNILLRTYSPLDMPSRLLPGMVFFHGGGWVAGSVDTHDGICRRLSNRTGCRLVSVEYRLAPEHPFPQGLNDGYAAVAHVLHNAPEFGIDPARLGVAGDSAGATLAAAICRMTRDAGGPPLAFQLLICPILDVLGEAVSRRELSEGYFLERETLLRDVELYCPGAERADPRLSPLCAADFENLPTAFIHTGEFDPFCDEGEAYAQRLGAAGVTVHGRAHPGMIHLFYAMPRMIPYALEAARVIGDELRYALNLPRPRERRAHRRMRPYPVRA